MSDCKKLEPSLTSYVDGELAAAERPQVEHHLSKCPPCHARVAAERAVRALIHARKADLGAERASDLLRSRCRARAAGEPAHRRVGVAAWVRSGLAPMALAASLVLVVGGAFVYQATLASPRLLAAELAADHVKCFGMNAVLGTHESTESVESAMLGGFGWRAHMPERFERMGLTLVGSRPCLYGGGKIAHLMYQHDGHPVSIFMLPKVVRAEELIDVLGYEAAVWSAGGRTFVLIAREPKAEVEQMAAVAHAALQ